MSKYAVPSASLTFKSLAFSAVLPDGVKKTIVEPCSGNFEPGQLVAIMGPSGSGKSTLLDMLAMKKTAPYSGDVFVNGRPREPTLFPRIAAYVPQEDHMPAYMKVREALEFNMTLKHLKSSQGVHGKRGMMQTLLEAFGLDGVAETYVGGLQVRGISGGQRRRLTLARGVAARPSLLFCDEATSGLSATDAEVCVKALRILAKRLNVLVMLVIHQPRREVQKLFDTLVLLTSNPGRMAYFGPMSNACEYMEMRGHAVPSFASPTDWFLDILTPGAEFDSSDELVEAFRLDLASEIDDVVAQALQHQGMTATEMLLASHGQAIERNPDAKIKQRLGAYAVPFHWQFYALLKRKVRITMRDPAAIGVQIGVPAGMGVLLGVLFEGIGHKTFGLPQVQCAFILCFIISLLSLPMIPIFVDERVFMKLEVGEKLYRESAHVLASSCVTIPLSLTGAVCEALITCAFTEFPRQYYPTIIGWCVLCYFFFDAVFQCCAAIAKSSDQAVVLSIPVLVVMMLFNGLIVGKATAPVFLRWLFEISPMRYSLQCIVREMALDSGVAGEAMLGMLGYEADVAAQGIVVVVCMTAFLRVVQVLCLKYLNNVQR